MRLNNTGTFPFNKLDFFLSVDIYEWYDDLFITYLETRNDYISYEELFGKEHPLKTPLIEPINSKEFDIHYNWETYEIYLYNKKENILVQTIKVDFEKQIEALLNEIILESIQLIHNTIEQLFLSSQNYILYLEQIDYQYEKLLQYDSIKKFPFLTNYLQNIKEEIDKIKQKSSINYSTSKKLKYSSPSQTYLSYVLLAETPEKQIKIIKKLYKLLIIKPALIEATEEEFINSFTGKEVTIGIKWLVLGSKNKLEISKPSLIYFIRTLIDNKFLSSCYYSNENKPLIYVFRDNNGKLFTSQQISSSKNSMSENPAESNRIDDIIYSLKSIL